MADEVVISVRAEDNFSGILGNFGNIMTGIKSAIDLAGDAFRLFGDFALEGLNAIASYERMAASFETLTAKELLAVGAAEDMNSALEMAGPLAEELLAWNQELAINSPFTAEGVANALRMAMAYGFTVEEAQRLTEAMIDFAAGSGASEAAMEAIARALGQISATGKVTGGDMLQLVNAGLPVVEILAEGFGVTTERLMEMRSAGLLPATEAIEYITTYLETNFAGAAERQANTWAGLQGTFADIKTMGLREFFGGMFDVLQPLAVALSNFLQTEGLDQLAEWGDRLGAFTQQFLDFLGLTSTETTQLFGPEFFFGGQSPEEIETIVFNDLETIFNGLKNKIVLWWASIDWAALGDNMEAGIISSINGVDWNALGYQFSVKLNAMFSADLTLEESGIDESMGNALTEFLAGMFGFVSWDELAAVFADGLEYSFAQTFGYVRWEDMGADFFNGADYLGQRILQGLANSFGYAEWVEFSNDFKQGFQMVINNIKSFLGISSPSTVFAGIGRDIVLGLIGGWTSTIGNFIETIEDSISNIIDLFPDWLQDAIGLGGADAGGLGTAGGGTAGGTTGGSSGTGGSGVVNNYFYGPVYIGSSLDDANYDCPSPNPLVGASGNQLVVTGY